MNHVKKLLVSISTIFIIQSIYSNVVIFDVGNVLVKKHSLSAMFRIGISNFVGRFWPLTLDKKLYELLERIDPRTENTPYATHNGEPLPKIMCDWLAGSRSNADILTLIEDNIEKNRDIFNSSGHKKAVLAIARFIFTPSNLIHAIHPFKQGVDLLKRCYNQRDSNGNRANRVYILSNWDPESFDLLLKESRTKDIFRYCDGILISGNCGLIKPQPEIFIKCFEEFNIDPTQEYVVFIDDEKANILSAQSLGYKYFIPIQYNCKKVNKTKKKLKQLGILVKRK